MKIDLDALKEYKLLSEDDFTDMPEWDFTSITDNTSFYLNQNNEVVVCFNEGDVAPMSMGCPEFVIPNEVLAGIRK
jgi:hypothetical protein